MSDNGNVRWRRRDKMSPSQRSYCMSRVRSQGTKLELMVADEFRRKKLKFGTHVNSLPGRPDFVFPDSRVVVFVDGDFWHGWRYPQWEHKLSSYWRQKITGNRIRDRKNFRRLRRMGWKVVRLWEHSIVRDIDASVDKVQRVL